MERDPIEAWFGERKPAEPAAAPFEPNDNQDDTMPSQAAQPARMPIRDHALACAARGFRVFPLVAGSKVPPTDLRWKEEATIDPAKIRAWWDFEPLYNFGVAAGDGLLVLDVDGEAGETALTALLKEHGSLPETLTVRTPGGGRHMYLACSDVLNSASRIGAGLDIRSAGGFVVGPGSFFADRDGKKGYTGSYQIISDKPAAEAPAWLPLIAGTPKEHGPRKPPMCEPDLPENIDWAVRAYLARQPEDGGAPIAIEGRGGNQTTYEMFVRLRELGISAEKSVELAEEHWNGRCLPPWSRSELVALAANASAYGQNRFGECAPTVVAEGFGEAVTIEPGAEGSAEWQAMNAAAEQRDQDDRLARLRGSLVRAEPGFAHHKAVPCVVEGLAWRGEVTIFWGPGSAGKSLFAEAMLPACAAAGKTLGKFRMPKPVKTLVLNTEDTESETLSRALACAEANGIDAETVRDGLLVMKRDLAIDFSVADYGSFKSLRINDRGIGDLATLARENGVSLIVLDPLSNLHGLDDNSVADMSVVLKAVRRLAREADAAVILLLHTNKAGLDRPGDPSAMGGSGKLTTGVRKTVSFFPARAGGKKHDEHPNADGEDAAGRFPVDLGKAEARTWVRMDDAKTNRGFGATTWLRIGGAGLPVLNEFGEPVTVPVMTLAYDRPDSTAGARGSSTVDPAREFPALDDADYAVFVAGFTDDDILNAMGALGSHWRREQLPALGARGPALDPADLAHTMVMAGCGWSLEASESERRARAMLRYLVETGRAELRETNAISHDGRKRLGLARSIRIAPERDKAVTPAMRVRELIERGSQTQDGTWLFDDGRSPRSIDLPFAIGFGIVSGDKFTRNGNAGTLTESEARQARFHVDTWIAEGRIVLSEEERAGIHYTLARLGDGKAKL